MPYKAKWDGPRQYDEADLPSLGWITITFIGEENVYFTLEDGTEAFFKY